MVIIHQWTEYLSCVLVGLKVARDIHRYIHPLGVVLWFFIAMARVIDIYVDSRYVCHNMAKKRLNSVGWM